MTKQPDRTIKGSVTALLIVSVLWLMLTRGQAAVVRELDITGGSISLNFGWLGTVAGTFAQTGNFSLHRTAQLAAAPAPAAFLLFASGLSGLVWLQRRTV